MSEYDVKNLPLHRGISSLFDSDKDDVSEAIEVNFHQQTTPIETLFPNPAQPRKKFAAEKLEELSQSITQNGVLQPLLVRPHPVKPNAYEIVAGERRWQAATKAGIDQVPILVKDLSDAEVIEIALIENIHRHDLTVIEEAQGYKMLLEQFDYTQEKLGKMLSKSRSHITNLLRLLKLPDSVQQLVNEQRLSTGHARALVGRDNAEQLAQQILDQGLNVRQTEILCQTFDPPSSSSDPLPDSAATTTSRDTTTNNADIKRLQKILSEQIDLPVRVMTNGNQGRITIRFQSLEEFDRLYQLLTQKPR